jgi:hypothetical protein
MVKKDKYKIELIDADNFKILHIYSNPPRLEAKVLFDRDHISQKLIFTLMEISHAHGFGCSPPHFKGPDDPNMIFLIGSILPSERSLNKYVKRIQECLVEIQDFANDFSRQLDFSRLDVSMFEGVDIDSFYPEHLSALKDQNYNGSWKSFYKDLVKEGRKEEAAIIKCCMKFEETNIKDIGFVGHKLSYTLHMLNQTMVTEYDSN